MVLVDPVKPSHHNIAGSSPTSFNVRSHLPSTLHSSLVCEGGQSTENSVAPEKCTQRQLQTHAPYPA
jgi:hypothetical protein